MLSLPRNPLVRLYQFALLSLAFNHPAQAETPPPWRTRAEVQAALPEWARSNRFPPFPELRDEESPAWLVRSRVVKREPWAQHPGFDLLSLMVTHSYCGPNLQGRIWELPYGRLVTTHHDLPAPLRPLRVGDEVICSLTSVWTSGAYSYHGSRGPLTKPVLGLKYNSYVQPYGLEILPRMNGSESASQVSELARTVEQASFTSADKLEAELNGLVRSSNPLIATWATSVYALGFRSSGFQSPGAPTLPLRDPMVTLALLRQLAADPGRSNRQRLVADDVLGWYDPDWKTSPQRFSALLPIYASRLDTSNVKILSEKLYPISWPRDSSGEFEQLRLIQAFMSNPAVPVEYKKHAFFLVPSNIYSPATLKFWSETMPLHWLYESAPGLARLIAGSPPTNPAEIAGITHIVTQWEVGAAITNSETRRKKLAKAIESVKAVLAAGVKGGAA